jgi:hypothetical protein
MSEHDEQVALFQYLETLKHSHPLTQLAYAIPNGGLRSKAVAGKLKAEGVKSGVLDIHLPVASEAFNALDNRFFIPKYTGLWVEMKYGKGKMTPNQKKWKKVMEEQGHKVVVCYTWVEAANAIHEYLGIKARL